MTPSLFQKRVIKSLPQIQFDHDPAGLSVWSGHSGDNTTITMIDNQVSFATSKAYYSMSFPVLAYTVMQAILPKKVWKTFDRKWKRLIKKAKRNVDGIAIMLAGPYELKVTGGRKDVDVMTFVVTQIK